MCFLYLLSIILPHLSLPEWRPAQLMSTESFSLYLHSAFSPTPIGDSSISILVESLFSRSLGNPPRLAAFPEYPSESPPYTQISLLAVPNSHLSSHIISCISYDTYKRNLLAHKGYIDVIHSYFLHIYQLVQSPLYQVIRQHIVHLAMFEKTPS